MTAPEPRVEVRLTATAGIRLAVTAVALVLALLALERSRTVLHWLVTAAVGALLLDGPVRALVARGMRRGAAVAVVTTAALAAAALLTYGAVDAVVEQYGHLREATPAAAAELVRDGPLRGLGTPEAVADRVGRLVDDAPRRLFGPPASVARTAAQRLGEVTLVVTLTVFLLVAYERLEERVARSSADGVLWRWSGVDAGLAAGARRARSAAARAVVGGALTAVVAQALDAPAPVVLGLWTAWWRLLPLLGPLVGVVPLALLLLARHGAVVALAALLVLAVAEAVLRAAWPSTPAAGAVSVPRASLTAVGFAAGFELGGVVGAAVGVVLVHLAVGVAESDDDAPRDQGPSRRPPPTTIPA